MVCWRHNPGVHGRMRNGLPFDSLATSLAPCQVDEPTENASAERFNSVFGRECFGRSGLPDLDFEGASRRCFSLGVCFRLLAFDFLTMPAAALVYTLAPGRTGLNLNPCCAAY